MSRLRNIAETGLLLAPGAALAGLAFASGGFLPDTTALVAVAALALLAVRWLAAHRPWSAFSAGALLAIALMAALCGWILVSASWSGALSRASIEAARALLYLVILVLFVSVPRSERRARTLVLGLAAAAVVVAVASTATWLMPDEFPVSGEHPRHRLGYPTSYWNATGLIAALGGVWCIHLCCSLSVGVATRAAGAAALPVLAACAWFTVSRGAILAAAVGIVVYVVVARPRGMLAGLPVAAAALTAGILVADSAEGLAVPRPSADALAEGERVALWLVICAALAGAARIGLRPLDRFAAAARVPRPRPAVAISTLAVLVIAAVGSAVVLDAPDRARDAYDSFVSDYAPEAGADRESRLLEIGNRQRVEGWQVALDPDSTAEVVRGTGAGTFVLTWLEERDNASYFYDAHSLYIETFSELGAVGLGLLVLVLASVAVALLLRARGPERGAWAVLLGAYLAWLVHAGVDWDWEMPAVTAWVFAAGGLALGRADPPPRTGRLHIPVRVAMAVVCAGLAVLPVVVHESQRNSTESVRALLDLDLERAEAAARDSSKWFDARPEPYEVRGYVALREGRARDAVRLFTEASRRDPDNWEFHYDRAIALAIYGRNPRNALRTARERNPRQTLLGYAERWFRRDQRPNWRRRGLAAPFLLVPPRSGR